MLHFRFYPVFLSLSHSLFSPLCLAFSYVFSSSHLRYSSTVFHVSFSSLCTGSVKVIPALEKVVVLFFAVLA